MNALQENQNLENLWECPTPLLIFNHCALDRNVKIRTRTWRWHVPSGSRTTKDITRPWRYDINDKTSRTPELATHTQDLETEGMSWKQKVPQMSGSFACQCLNKVSAREIQMQSFTEWTDTHLQWAVKHQTLQVRLVGKLLHKRTESEGSRVSLARSLVGS